MKTKRRSRAPLGSWAFPDMGWPFEFHTKRIATTIAPRLDCSYKTERSFVQYMEIKMMSPPEKTPSKRDGVMAARRNKILEAAVMCFLESGYHQTGVRDIATRADISLGNLYNHFPSKHDVLIEIARLERAEQEQFIQQLDKRGSPLKRFDKFLTGYAKYLAAPENVILSIEITSEAIRKEDLGELFNENRQAMVNALERLLKSGVDQGEFRFHGDARETAHLILELIEGRAFHSVLGDMPMRKMIPGLTAFLRAALGVSEQKRSR